MKRVIAVGLMLCMILNLVSCNIFTPEAVETIDTGIGDGEEQSESSLESSDEVVTIDWYIHKDNYRRSWNAEEVLIEKIITEKTGVNINLVTGYGSKGDENIIQMITSDDMPDVISVDRYYDIFSVVQGSNKVHDLNELIDTYAPDFRDEIPKSMINTYTQPNGEWYAFLNFFKAPEKMTEDNYLETNNLMVARDDIMKLLDITPEDFKTEEGMYEALKKVKESGITVDGKPMIPFISLFRGWGLIEYLAIPLEDENGHLQAIEKDPEYLRRLIFINKLLREGLLTYEIFTAGNDQINQMVREGRVFCFNGTLPTPGIIDLYDSDPTKKYVAVEPVRASDGRRPYIQSGMAGWMGSFISKDTEHPEEIIKLFQFLYSEEGQLLTMYGVEGVTYNMEDGRVVRTQAAKQALDDDTYDNTYGAPFWPMREPFYIQSIEPLPEDDTDRMFKDIQTFYSQYIYNELPFKVNIPKDSEYYEIHLMKNELFDIKKILLADSDEQVIEEYYEALDNLAANSHDSLIQEMDDQFQANKERFEIEYAWPSYTE